MEIKKMVCTMAMVMAFGANVASAAPQFMTDEPSEEVRVVRQSSKIKSVSSGNQTVAKLSAEPKINRVSGDGNGEVVATLPNEIKSMSNAGDGEVVATLEEQKPATIYVIDRQSRKVIRWIVKSNEYRNFINKSQDGQILMFEGNDVRGLLEKASREAREAIIKKKRGNYNTVIPRTPLDLSVNEREVMLKQMSYNEEVTIMEIRTESIDNRTGNGMNEVSQITSMVNDTVNSLYSIRNW